jgi:archaellum component FlaC
MESHFNERANVTFIGGYHKYGKGDSDVQVFFVNAQSTSRYIPANICDKFKNINKIDIFGKKIVELQKESFSKCLKVKKFMIRHIEVKTFEINLLSTFGRLETFILEQSAIEVIPANFFRYNYKLKDVSMTGNNKLKIIEAEFKTNLTSLVLYNNNCIDLGYNRMSYRSVGTLDQVKTEIDKKCKNGTSSPSEIETPEQLRLTSLEEKIIENFEKFLGFETKIENEISNLHSSLRGVQFSVTSSENNFNRLKNGDLEPSIKDIKDKSILMETKLKTYQNKSEEISEKVKKSQELRDENENLKSSISTNKHLITTMLTFQSIIIAYIFCVVIYGKFHLAKKARESSFPQVINGRTSGKTRRPEMTEYLIADDDE